MWERCLDFGEMECERDLNLGNGMGNLDFRKWNRKETWTERGLTMGKWIVGKRPDLGEMECGKEA